MCAEVVFNTAAVVVTSEKTGRVYILETRTGPEFTHQGALGCEGASLGGLALMLK